MYSCVISFGMFSSEYLFFLCRYVTGRKVLPVCSLESPKGGGNVGVITSTPVIIDSMHAFSG